MDEARQRQRQHISESIASLRYESRRPYSIVRIAMMQSEARRLIDLLNDLAAPTPEDEVQITDVAHEAVSPPLRREDPTKEIKTGGDHGG